MQDTILKCFPRFGEDALRKYEREVSAEDRRELGLMFQVVDIRNPQPGGFVVSTSLYCKPHDPELAPIAPLALEELKKPNPGVRGGSSWWAEYMEPLLKGIERIPEPWSVRIHLAADLLFLESYLRHPRVELRIMFHNSECTMPGMLWRYLPLNEPGVVMARGTDTPWPDTTTMRHIDTMLKSEAVLFRRFRPKDIDSDGLCVYRTIPGPLVMKVDQPLNFTRMAKAWLWHARQGLLETRAALPFHDEPVSKFGLSHWARYGQDEQMLSHWLYYVAAGKGIYTVVDKTHQSQLWQFDREFVETRSKRSVVVMV